MNSKQKLIHAHEHELAFVDCWQWQTSHYHGVEEAL